MSNLSRKDILDTLQTGWGTYVQRFQKMSPAAQTAFLKQQGYARLADLLAHVVAWWEVGHHAIDNYLSNPAFVPPGYNVDSFNAEAVAGVSGVDEHTMIESFEKARISLIAYIRSLPDAAFENEKVVNQFNMDVIGHLQEHALLES
jgi:hypothetical protein